MAQAKKSDLAEVVRERVDIDVPERFELTVRGSARADEVRVVGVRQPVCVGARRREHGLFFEYEHDVDGAGRDKRVGDRLRPLRVHGRVRLAFLYVKLGAEACGEGREEARAAGSFCARNRLGLFVPCHRVVAAAGLGSYGSTGVEYKRRLLALEGYPGAL